ncbi:MAG: hypothetical protein CMJ18_05315 [Phycisphaeraceae bacterium]|nr:hypothetical protein [Phycisphaeraceae bacterium]
MLLVAWTTAPVAAADEDWLPGGVAVSGINFVRQDHWSTCRSQIRNPEDEEAELLLSVTFKQTPFVQFTGSVWLPPRSRRTVQFPVRAQKVKAARSGVDAVEVQALLLAPGRPTPRLARKDGLMAREGEKSRPTTAVMEDGDDNWNAGAATAVRLALDKPRRLFYLRDSTLPDHQIGWEGLDTLVVARHRPHLGGAQLEALRRWILSGGRLWVMAEQVDPSFLARLLGNDWTCRAVDRVELSEFRFDGGSGRGRTLAFEDPIEMVRLYAPQWTVLHEVRGWPASLHRRFGLGRVLLTTVGPRAWYADKWVVDRKKKSRRIRVKQARPSLLDLLPLMGRRDMDRPIEAAPLAEFASDRIGYQTLGRSGVGWILGLYVVGIGVAGFMLMAVRRLEHTAWIGPALAVLASLTLIWIGTGHQGKVPLTVSEARIAQITPQRNHAIVHGALAIYSPQKHDEKGLLSAERGGIIWPNLRYQSAELLRLQWDDVDRWSWGNLALPPGAMLTGEFHSCDALAKPVGADVQFGPDGARGTIEPGPFGQIDEVVVVGRNGAFAPSISPERSFTIGATGTLTRSQYQAGTTLSHLQRQRLDVYRQLFEDPKRPFPTEPTLFAWVESLDPDYALKRSHERLSTTLLAIPLRFRPTPAGQRVSVPDGFVAFSADRGPGGDGSTTVYDPRQRKWIQSRDASLVVLRFSLPASVLPLKMDGGLWMVDVDAPGRTVEAFRYAGSERVPLKAGVRSIGPTEIDLASESVSADDDGSVYLALRIGPHPEMTAKWQINDVSLRVSGTVGERD